MKTDYNRRFRSSAEFDLTAQLTKTSCLMAYDALLIDKYLPTFRKTCHLDLQHSPRI